MTFYTDVKNGKLQKNVSTHLRTFIGTFEGKRIQITIEKIKSQRSAQQNALWWVYMTILSKELGYTKDEIHEICKYKFLKREKVDEKSGEIFPYLESTTKLSKSEFADLVSDLQQWAADTFNINLPSPGEQTDLDL